MTSSTSDAHRAIEAVWRIESARLIGGLARVVGDVGLAEELAQDALVAALEQWPQGGVPVKPGAWLMGTAKHRAIDLFRRTKRLATKYRAVAVGMAFGPAAGLELANALVEEQALRAYHRLPSVRADLLFKVGRFGEARTEFERAASLTRNERERRLLLSRARECARR